MKEPILTKNFICTFIAQFSLALVFYTLIGTITEHVASFGTSTTIAGMVSGVYVVGGLVSRLASGRMTKRYGWKNIALIFSIIHLAGSCLYALADNIFLLLIIRFIHGIGFGAATNTAMIIGMSCLPKSRYAEAAGYLMVSASLGVAIGPFAGGLIYDSFGGSGCFTAASVFSAITVIAVILTDTSKIDPWYERRISERNGAAAVSRPEGEKHRFTLKSIIEPEAVPISFCILFLCFGYAALMSFYRLYGHSEGLSSEFRYFFLIYAAMLIISRPAAGKIQDRFGDNAVVYPCILAQVIGITLLAARPCMLTIIICALCGALGYGTLNSTLNTIINRRFSGDRRPTAVATYWALSDLAIGIAPAILGAIAGASGYHALYYTAALISLIALPVYHICWGRSR